MDEQKPRLPGLSRRRLLAGLGALGAGGLLTGCDSLSQNPRVQEALGSANRLTRAAHRLIASQQSLAREYDPSAIAPAMRPNGTTLPESATYRRMAVNGFADWRLTVDGKVEHPSRFSLAELKALPSRSQITRHDCVEGWSCIAQWRGVVLGDLLDRVGPTADARFVVFYCADNVYGEPDYYYESLDLIEAYHPQTLLAYGLNGADLPIVNGAPLRLRSERQLGYKMAKYVMRVELVDSLRLIQGGKGGYWEDRGYEWWAGI